MPASNRLSILLDAQIAGFQTNMDRATRKVDRFGKEVSDTNRELGGFGRSVSLNSLTRQADLARGKIDGIGLAFSSVGRLFSGTLALGGLTRLGEKITEVSDNMKLIEVRAKGLGGGAGGFDAIYESAQRLGIPIADVADGVNSLAPALARIDVGFKDSVKFAEDLNQSMRLFGVSGAQAASVVTQLSQGLLSGTLAGDELKSLRENAAGLLPSFEAAVKQITGVNGSLKDLGSQGVLTSDVVYEAFQQTFAGLRGRFDELPNTLEQNRSRIGNSWDRLVAAIDKRWQVSAFYKDITGGIAEKLDAQANALGGETFFDRLVGNFSRGAEPIFKAIDTIGEKAKEAGAQIKYLLQPKDIRGNLLFPVAAGVSEIAEKSAAAAKNVEGLGNTLDAVAKKKINQTIEIQISGDALKSVDAISERLASLNRGDELNSRINADPLAKLTAVRKQFSDLWRDINSFDPASGVTRTAKEAVKEFDAITTRIEKLKETTKDPLNLIELQRAAGQLRTFSDELFKTPTDKPAPTTYLEAVNELASEGGGKWKQIEADSTSALQASADGFAAWQSAVSKMQAGLSNLQPAAKAAVDGVVNELQRLTQQAFTINIIANVSEQTSLLTAEEGSRL